MNIYYGFDGLSLATPVVTMGTFDGVHRGHQMVLSTLKEFASSVNGESVVITFYPHPRQILNGISGSLPLLTTLQEKIILIEKCGIDHLVIIEFDHEFSNKEACDFIEEILVEKIGAKHLIVGFNHHFGKRGEGNFNTIKQCAAASGLKLEMVGAMENSTGVISSSAIRDALTAGRLEQANDMLGYSYFIKGSIVEGKKLGRRIGYPTANINPGDNEKLIPMDGVYAVEIIIEGEKFNGVMSIGKNPTIDRHSEVRSIEVNIFRFSREIYGCEVEVSFRYRLRDEMTFTSLRELASQIEADRERAISLLGR